MSRRLLDDVEQGNVRALASSVEAEDGQPPLSDQALTQLGSTVVQHTLALDDNDLVGYAQLDGESLEIVGVPEAVTELIGAFGESPLLVWSHGKRSRLVALLAERGFDGVRTLHQLRRGLGEPFDVLPAPAGMEIRPFVVGRDENEWVRVNAAAFADHPEQGGWTLVDLAARESEPWFDPSGFLLAWRGEELAGFHWTKVHPDTLGEVYVIGVDPFAQGTGLGKVLLLHGLAYLRARGCREVLLYVDDDNAAAMRLYEQFGFARYDRDSQWRRG